MAQIAHCPKCNVAIGQLDLNGTIDTLCSKCGRVIRILNGSVNKVRSDVKTLVKKSKNSNGKYRRDYELRLKDEGNNIHVINFHTPGKEECFKIYSGDRLSFNYIEGKLNAIANETTGLRYVFSSAPLTKNQERTAIHAGISLSNTILVWALAKTPIFGIAAGVVTWILLRRWHKEVVARETKEQTNLASNQQLLAEIKNLQVKKITIKNARNNYLSTLNKLQSLQQKMESVGADVYPQRLKIVNKGIQLIQCLVANEERLMAEYDRAITMLEIDYETATTVDLLEDNNAFLSKFEEIKAMESLNDELITQLQANQEVAQMS